MKGISERRLIYSYRMDTHSIWAFTRKLKDRDQDRLWLMPDFNFFASPPIGSTWFDMQRRARIHDSPLMDKIPKIVWRGVKWTAPDVRGSLLDVTKGKEWADVIEVDHQNGTNMMSMDELCRYMFVTHTEGRSWSGKSQCLLQQMVNLPSHIQRLIEQAYIFIVRHRANMIELGRLKFLLNCNSLPVVHDLEWTAEFYHLLVPNGPHQNYIQVNRDFSNLENKITYYLEHPEEAHRIAVNAVNTFRSRYTSPAAEACYWRRLISGWSEVAFDPEPFETVSVNISGKSFQEEQLRGIPYEEFL